MLDILAIIREFTATNSSAFILKTKNILKKFHYIFRIYIKFEIFG